MFKHRLFTQTLFWFVFVFVLGGMMLSVYKLIGAFEIAGTADQSEKIAITIAIPFGIALFGFAHSALMQVMNRALVSDSELSDLAAEEADRFRKALHLFLTSKGQSLEILDLVVSHAQRTNDLEKQIWVKLRRDRVDSHWKLTAETLFCDALSAEVEPQILKGKVQSLLAELPLHKGFFDLARSALERVVDHVDTSWTLETTKPAQGGLSH